MASPFKVFRKHQKLMLAVLGILVMLSFSIGGVVSQLVGTQKNQNPVIVRTTKYGKLDAGSVLYATGTAKDLDRAAEHGFAGLSD